MADIIFFTPRERSEGVARAGEPAAVIIFPGVRYERSGLEEAGKGERPQTNEQTGRRGRRRRLS
jgi:hypothetical protein